MNDAQLRGRLTLLAISALFITPIIVATYLYFSGDNWNPVEGTQRGDLITPPIQLPDLELDAEGDHQLHRIWSLVVIADEQCSSECVTALEHIRQIRLSLGPKMTRLQTVLLPGNPQIAAGLDREAFPVLVIASPAAAAQITALVDSWSDGQIFLVDPLGNLMMSYPAGSPMGDVRKDLGHLLKISEIG